MDSTPTRQNKSRRVVGGASKGTRKVSFRIRDWGVSRQRVLGLPGTHDQLSIVQFSASS